MNVIATNSSFDKTGGPSDCPTGCPSTALQCECYNSELLYKLDELEPYTGICRDKGFCGSAAVNHKLSLTAAVLVAIVAMVYWM